MRLRIHVHIDKDNKFYMLNLAMILNKYFIKLIIMLKYGISKVLKMIVNKK
jgi:hypothetical protein